MKPDCSFPVGCGVHRHLHKPEFVQIDNVISQRGGSDLYSIFVTLIKRLSCRVVFTELCK
jgi:hypothetical protein